MLRLGTAASSWPGRVLVVALDGNGGVPGGSIGGEGRVVPRPAHRPWEVRPVAVSKAPAVRALMPRATFAVRVRVCVGDDVSDEAGMAAAREFGGVEMVVGREFSLVMPSAGLSAYARIGGLDGDCGSKAI